MRAVRVLTIAGLLFAVATIAHAQDEDAESDNSGDAGRGDDATKLRVLSHYWGRGHIQNDGMHIGKLNSNNGLVNDLAKIVAAGDVVVALGIRDDGGDIVGGIPKTATEVANQVKSDVGVEYTVAASVQSGGNGAAGRGPQYECKFPEQVVFFINTAAAKLLQLHNHNDQNSGYYINPATISVEAVLGHDADKLDDGADLFQFNVAGVRLDSDPNRDNNHRPNRVAHELEGLGEVYDQAQDSLGERGQLTTGTFFADCGTNEGGSAAFNAIDLFDKDDNTVFNEGSTERGENCRYDMHIGNKQFVDGKAAGFVETEVVPITGLGINIGPANLISPHEAVRTTITYTAKTFGAPDGNLLLVLLAASAVAGAILGGAYYARQKSIENEQLLYGGMSSKGSMSDAGMSSKGGFVAAGAARPQTAVSGISSYTRGGAAGGPEGDRMSGMTGLTRGDALGMGGGRSSRGSRSSKSSRSKSRGSRSSKSSKSSKSRSSRGSHGSKSHKSRGSRSGSSGNRMTGVSGFTRGGSTGGYDGVSSGTRGTSGTSTSHATHKSRTSHGSKGSKGSHASRKSRSSSGSKATHASKATRSSSGSGR